jgi:hypothetical protein
MKFGWELRASGPVQIIVRFPLAMSHRLECPMHMSVVKFKYWVDVGSITLFSQLSAGVAFVTIKIIGSLHSTNIVDSLAYCLMLTNSSDADRIFDIGISNYCRQSSSFVQIYIRLLTIFMRTNNSMWIAGIQLLISEWPLSTKSVGPSIIRSWLIACDLDTGSCGWLWIFRRERTRKGECSSMCLQMFWDCRIHLYFHEIEVNSYIVIVIRS